MSSFRSKIIIWMIRNRHLFQGHLKPEVVDESFSVDKFRAQVDSASAKVKLPADVGVQAVRIGEMYAEWIASQTPSEGKVLLYIHGGGFISGSCLSHRMHVARFARECGIRSLLFDYRLAPEHPFPAAPEDCVTAYKWLLEQGIAPHNIVVGGESAGATLTLSLLLALKEQQIDLPRAAFVISPVTDLRCGAASFTYNAPHDVAPMGSWTVWTNMYIAGNDPTNPLLSPLFGDFRGLPPLYICVGTHEIHYEDCVAISRVAREHGVDVTLREWDRMVHAFPLLPPLFPEAKAAFAEICAFVKNL
jgi:acetyl esterase/lipase